MEETAGLAPSKVTKSPTSTEKQQSVKMTLQGAATSWSVCWLPGNRMVTRPGGQRAWPRNIFLHRLNKGVKTYQFVSFRTLDVCGQLFPSVSSLYAKLS